MSDYPQIYNSLANYLSLATELSGQGVNAQCTAYYCRLYWAKKAGEMYKNAPNKTQNDYDYLVNQIQLIEQIKSSAPIVTEEKGKDAVLAYIAEERKSIVEMERMNCYDEIIKRYKNLIDVISAAVFLMPEKQGLSNILKSTKGRLLEVFKAKKENRPIQSQPVGSTTVQSQPSYNTFPPSFAGENMNAPAFNPMPMNDFAPSFNPTPLPNNSPSVPSYNQPSSIPDIPSFNPTPLPNNSPSIPDIPPMPNMRGLSGMSSMPDIPPMSGMPDMPPMSGMSGMPSMPSMPGMPSMPSMPGMPSMPDMPPTNFSNPSFNSPSVPDMPPTNFSNPSFNSPSVPDMPPMSGMPSMPPTNYSNPSFNSSMPQNNPPSFPQNDLPDRYNSPPSLSPASSLSSGFSNSGVTTTGYENNISLLLGLYDQEAKACKEKSPRLAKAIYEAMINACRSDSHFASYVPRFQSEMDQIHE